MNSQIAQSMVLARRERSEVPAEPVPDSIADCYEISAEVAGALRETVGGWKVGGTPQGAPAAAPMYKRGFVESGARFPLQAGRPMIPEIEIAVRLARGLPASGAPYTRETILAAASELLLGIELIERRIPKGADFKLNLADDLGNIGYVVGPSRKDFAPLDLARLRCQFWIGGELKTDRAGGHAKGDPTIPMVDWANAQRDRLGGMKAGQIVTLGSLTPMIEVTAPTIIEAELEGFGRVSVELC